MTKNELALHAKLLPPEQRKGAKWVAADWSGLIYFYSAEPVADLHNPYWTANNVVGNGGLADGAPPRTLNNWHELKVKL